MDLVHRPDEREEISEKVHLKTYFLEFRKNLVEGRPEDVKDYRKMSRTRVKHLVGGHTSFGTGDNGRQKIDEALFSKVEDMCSIDNLTIEGECPPMKVILGDDESVFAIPEIRKFEVVEIPEEGKSKLKTLQYLDKASEEETRKRILNLRNFNDTWFEATPKPPSKIKPEMVENAIVISVRVYRPIKNNPRQPISSFRYVQEILLLGTNTLSDLRDFIKCPVDYMIHDDVSENPFEMTMNPITGRMERIWESQRRNKDVYKSGFIYIEGCFYNDTRWSNETIDYSEVIREWASHPKRQLGPFTTAKMEETTIEDLTVRFGYPYVYMHQGDHEHLIAFIDARLMTVDDPQHKRNYPFERSIGLSHSKYCIVCCDKIARWVTSENDRVPEDPFYFCDECFKEFNYTEDGKKKGKFRAFNFVESNAL